MEGSIDFLIGGLKAGTGLETLHQGATAYPRGTRIGPVRWPHFDLLIIPRGELAVEADGEEFACRAGTALLIPPDCTFKGIAGPEGAVLWVQHFRSGKRTSRTGPQILPGSAAGEWTQSLMRRLADIQSRKTPGMPQPESGILLQLLLSALMESIARRPVVSGFCGARIESLVAQLETSPPPLPTIEELAIRSGWCASQFRFHFIKHTGMTPGDFLRRLRMKSAQKLLVETTHPIKEIALLSGYSDPVTFHRAFVAHTHTTPGKFRAAHPRFI